MIPLQNENHTAEARLLLTDQFRDRNVIQGILDSWVNMLQVFENVVFDIIEKRVLDNAEDAQLDSVGDLVGEPRLGRGDDEYREAIRLRIRINRSNGRAEDVIAVADLSTDGEFTYDEHYPASFEVEALNVPSPRALANAIKKSKAAGTYGNLITSNWAAADTFVWDYGGGGVADPGLWDYTGDESVSSDRWTLATET